MFRCSPFVRSILGRYVPRTAHNRTESSSYISIYENIYMFWQNNKSTTNKEIKRNRFEYLADWALGLQSEIRGSLVRFAADRKSRTTVKTLRVCLASFYDRFTGPHSVDAFFYRIFISTDGLLNFELTKNFYVKRALTHKQFTSNGIPMRLRQRE